MPRMSALLHPGVASLQPWHLQLGMLLTNLKSAGHGLSLSTSLLGIETNLPLSVSVSKVAGHTLGEGLYDDYLRLCGPCFSLLPSSAIAG